MPNGMIPIDTIDEILFQIRAHLGTLQVTLESKALHRHKLAHAVGAAAAISELAKLGLQKIEG